MTSSLYHPSFSQHSPGQKHWLGLWEAAAVLREEGMAAQAGVVVVRVVWTLWVKLLGVVV